MAKEKPDDKGGERARPTLLPDAGTPFRGGAGGGWVVVSFIGPAGLDVSELAVRMLRGTPSLPALSQGGTSLASQGNGGTERKTNGKTSRSRKRTKK